MLSQFILFWHIEIRVCNIDSDDHKNIAWHIWDRYWIIKAFATANASYI